jgi:hypothetical protein
LWMCPTVSVPSALLALKEKANRVTALGMMILAAQPVWHCAIFQLWLTTRPHVKLVLHADLAQRSKTCAHQAVTQFVSHVLLRRRTREC